MKNKYPRHFINKVLTKIRDRQHVKKSSEQPKQSKRTVPLPYMNGTSEMTAGLLRYIHSWYSEDYNTITVYLQLKTVRKIATNNGTNTTNTNVEIFRW